MENATAPLEFLLDEVKKAIEEFRKQPPFLEVVKGFIDAVDWQERWIIGLLCSHVIFLSLVVAFRRNMRIQMAIFSILVALLVFAEKINTIMSANWQSFSKQNYFDGSGYFISIMWTIPWLLILLLILVNLVIESSILMAKLKRTQLVIARRNANQTEGASEASTEGKKDQ